MSRGLQFIASGLACCLGVSAASGTARAAGPDFQANFDSVCADRSDDWKVSNQLRRQGEWADRFACKSQAGSGNRYVTIEVRPGDGRDNPANSNSTERAEIQIKRGDLVQFDEPVWYRFKFRLDGPWQGGSNRTVLHQIKQNIATNFDAEIETGAPCVSANPFFRVHVREFEPGRLALRADIAESIGCPSEAGRHVICPAVPIETDRWYTINVAMRPSPQTARGYAKVWVDGVACGDYRGRFGYPTYGVKREGKPFIDTPPRFGIYRDKLAVTQRVSFDEIAFWREKPAASPLWSGITAIEAE